MHPTRRRKKRPSYGVRTVEVQRGTNGFGFTISGQAPCLLSCIVAASPADAAGLRPGDYLLAVNGQNVAASLHDDVVQLIGSTHSTLRLQIAENYYTDSSEDEACVASRNKHKPAHRARHRHGAPRAGPAGGRSPADSWDDEEPARRVPGPPPPPRDPQGFLQPTAPAVRPVRRTRPGPSHAAAAAVVAAAGGGERLVITEQAVNGLIYPTLQELQRERQQEADPALFRAVVGYLGTIEMPKEKDLAGSRLQAIRNCIRRLRVEKKVHTLVLMSVFPSRVSLSNTHGWALATYPADRITFCGIYADDKRFFGLVTVHRHDDPSDQSQDESSPPPLSSSCHVFMVDPKLAAHTDHAKRARTFGLQCSVAPGGGGPGGRCQEFPDTAEPILQAILSLYRNRVLPGMADPEMQPASPPHSNTSSNSSNSDSGIGFRDDGHPTERIFVVDVERERLRIHRVSNQGGVMGPPPPPPPAAAGRHAERRVAPTLQHSNSCRSSDCSFVRSLEDLRGAGAGGAAGGLGGGCGGGGGRLAAARLWHGSDTELARMVTGSEARRFVRSLERHPDEVRTDPGGHITPATSAASAATDEEAMAELEPEAKQRWTKGQSFRRRLNRRALSPPPASRSTSQPTAAAAAAAAAAEDDPQLAKAYGNVLEAAELGSQTDSVSAQSERTGASGGGGGAAEEGGRAASWGSSFERLLEDPAGLHTFAEFLKSQFSHENIYFWVACERYKQLSEAEARRQVALQIYERHLCVGAPEPVNVDSQAQQAAQDGVDQAAVTLFDKAQQQIFSLMKFDCYPRFLKASIYTNCVSREAAGQKLPYLGGDALDPDLRLQPEDKKLSKKGSKPESGERRRKSLLPWHRKDRSKSKDRGEADYKRKKRQREREETGSVRSDLSGSRSSLASADLANLQRNAASRESLHVPDQPSAGGGGSSAGAGAGAVDSECLLCRVVLPDSSSAVVQAAPGDSVRVMLQRLIDRRGLPYNSWDVYLANSDRPLDQSVDSCCLGCKEIRMEQRVLFRVDLPNQKTIGVKAKPNRQTCEVLKPILGKYGCKLDNVHVFESGGGAPLDTKVPVTRLDNRHLVVRWRDETPAAAEPAAAAAPAAGDARHRPFPSLDEITNRVFDDLLKGKADGNFDDFGVIDLDQNSSKTDGSSSDRSSGPLASMVRRNSLTSGREARRTHRHQTSEAHAMGPPPPPPPPRLADAKETDVALYEGLKRAQMCRLDDQRGTEINFELPEFLRKREAVQNKENYRPERLSAPVMSRRPGSGAAEARLSMVPAGWRTSRQLGGILPTDQQAEDYFQTDFESSGRLSLGLSDGGQLGCPPMPRLTPRRPEPSSPPPPTPPDPLATSLHLDEADFSPPTPLAEVSVSARPRLAAAAAATPPPPLPPKPKVLLRGPPPRPPARAAPAEDLAAGRSRKAIYLDKAERLNISFV